MKSVKLRITKTKHDYSFRIPFYYKNNRMGFSGDIKLIILKTIRGSIAEYLR